MNRRSEHRPVCEMQGSDMQGFDLQGSDMQDGERSPRRRIRRVLQRSRSRDQVERGSRDIGRHELTTP